MGFHQNYQRMANELTGKPFMEVLAARCAVRKTSRHDSGVPDPGTLRAPR
ncbi:MAG: hypothetical protein O2868_09565 [Proteobacteria bacterium]|nr:hypothetical protein [Pseudomonadota bacterium]